MGCFDTVHYRCPSCHRELEQQSKGGECGLRHFGLHTAPMNVLGGIDMEDACRFCGVPYRIRVCAVSITPMPTVPNLSNASDPRCADDYW